MNYVCSQCGGEVRCVTLTSWPGKDKYTCEKCGAVKIVEPSVFIQTVDMPVAEAQEKKEE